MKFKIFEQDGQDAEIINCTPHDIVVKVEGGDKVFKPSGTLPRVDTRESSAPSINGIPCVTQTVGEVTNLPAPTPNTFYIVSGMVFAATDREDVIAPDTGKSAIRNDKNQIAAVTKFLRK